MRSALKRNTGTVKTPSDGSYRSPQPQQGFNPKYTRPVHQSVQSTPSRPSASAVSDESITKLTVNEAVVLLFKRIGGVENQIYHIVTKLDNILSGGKDDSSVTDANSLVFDTIFNRLQTLEEREGDTTLKTGLAEMKQSVAALKTTITSLASCQKSQFATLGQQIANAKAELDELNMRLNNDTPLEQTEPVMQEELPIDDAPLTTRTVELDLYGET